MTYDSLFYDVLTPMTLMLRGYAGVFMGLAICFQWIRASWTGATRDRAVGWQDAVACLVVWLLFYIPVPDPGKLIGLADNEPTVTGMTYSRTTAAIFLTERVSYGADHLITEMLAFDMTIRASADYPGTPGASEHVGEPTAPNAVYAFIALRAQFVMRYAGSMLSSMGEPRKDAQGNEIGGGFLDSLVSGQVTEYVQRQVAILFYQVGSLFTLLVAYVVMALVSVVLLLLAGLARFGAILVFVVVLFALPIGYAIRGLKALWTALGMVLVYAFVKAVIVLVIWASFFILEGVVLQHFRELAAAAGDSALVGSLEALEPGAVYTPAGSDLLMLLAEGGRIAEAKSALGMTLLSFIVILIAMVYICFKVPAMLGALFGFQSLAEDAITSGLFIGASAATFGASTLTKTRELFSGDKQVNRMDSG